MGKKKHFEDLTGRRFGRITVLKFAGKDRYRHPLWEARCDCGHVWNTDGYKLVNGPTQSCGCLGREITSKRVFKHGHATYDGRGYSREWNSYCSAKSRCNNPRSINYNNYGGRGIEFRFTSFVQFLEHLGPRPEGTSIDRINNDGNYEPGNVRWATASEQQRNKRKSRKKEKHS